MRGSAFKIDPDHSTRDGDQSPIFPRRNAHCSPAPGNSGEQRAVIRLLARDCGDAHRFRSGGCGVGTRRSWDPSPPSHPDRAYFPSPEIGAEAARLRQDVHCLTGAADIACAVLAQSRPSSIFEHDTAHRFRSLLVAQHPWQFPAGLTAIGDGETVTGTPGALPSPVGSHSAANVSGGSTPSVFARVVIEKTRSSDIPAGKSPSEIVIRLPSRSIGNGIEQPGADSLGECKREAADAGSHDRKRLAQLPGEKRAGERSFGCSTKAKLPPPASRHRR